MSVTLADRSFQYPVGIAKNMLIEISKFYRPLISFVLEIWKKIKQINLGVGNEQMIFNIDSAMKHSYLNDDTCFSIVGIDEILEEDSDALLDECSKILHSIEGTLLEEEILSQLSKEKKNKLVSILKKHKEAFAWKTTNIHGICPSFCKHKIQLLDDKKPVIQKQRRLNPNMQEVVKK
ncbi:hypothetical protein Tco_1478655 [Tanacetum coccineum]